jgi:PAS domain S-box-containing protein
LWSDSELARIVDEVVPAAVRDGTWEGETTLIIPGGENVPVSLVLVAHPSTWEGEPPYFISAVIRDLRERVAGERALRDSESRKQSMLDTALDCVLSIDHEGRITEFNPAAETTFGYLREEVIGKRIADVLVPERLRDVHRFDFEHNLATGESHMLGRLTEMVALRGDGSEFVCEYSITRLPIEGPPSYTAFMRDITARKRLQESLAAEREFLRAVLENLSEGVAVADAQGEHALLNRSLRTMLGLHQGNAPTRLPFLRDLYQDDGVTPLLPEDMPLVRANRGEEVDDVELIHAPPGRESRTLLANARRIVDSSGQHQGAVVALHDITERRRAERLRSQLIRTVSHELRTPLTAIRGSLEMLEKKSESLGDSGRALLGMALRNASHLARMVNDLLDVERIESGTSSLEQEWVETRSLIDAARDITTAVAESARVRVEAEGEPLKVWADPDRIVQVLTNLIGNAVKFSPPDSTIRVSASMFDDDTAVCFTVKDEGRGIPADRLDSIFEPFEQVEAKDAQDRGGFGLGLAICRAIVRQHRGTIWADSEPGQGSTFRFVLPANFDQDS